MRPSSEELGLYLVTDAALCGARGIVRTVELAVEGGARVVQLREKHADLAEHVRLLERLARVIDARALLLVNDRVDAAVAARERGIRVDGVHLGQGDEDVRRARDLLGPDAVIGLSANTSAHLDAVAALPEGTVDHVGIGAIRATATKADHPPALGIEGFALLAAASPVPSVAIGGITAADVPALRRAGASGCAVVSAVCAADDPLRAARVLCAAWSGAASDQ
ncbi:thiamine phosphate synthase [Brachybacterium sp. ACRRE]|uniref:thiamine phosphate synthase n=1 Tax=Brachybacterium sp. ACRRE TaxID=2918184 RepID=UPI0027146C9D|nr:thiamine phosphate synthase [Brachybacterium sp. ACRRE]